MSVAEELTFQRVLVERELDTLLDERDALDARIRLLHVRLGVMERAIPWVEHGEESVRIQTGVSL